MYIEIEIGIELDTGTETNTDIRWIYLSSEEIYGRAALNLLTFLV